MLRHVFHGRDAELVHEGQDLDVALLKFKTVLRWHGVGGYEIGWKDDLCGAAIGLPSCVFYIEEVLFVSEWYRWMREDKA